jgi:hypothetical protein
MLKYTKDIYGKEVLCDEDEKHQIMMEWEKSYMEKSIEILDPFGQVLEIGFGMGYSASKICSYDNVKEYNVIECSPIVWEKCESFIKNMKEKRPELKVNLIKGRWEDMLITLGKFNCIYFDDYVLDSTFNINVFNKNRLKWFMLQILKNNTYIGSKISFYSTTKLLNLYEKLNCINIKCIEYEINIPDNCNYARGNKMYIPLFTKITDADDDIKEKLLPNINDITENNLMKPEILKEIEKQKKYKMLFDNIKQRKPSCGLIVIDNFYNNPYETREFILKQEFSVKGNYPGQRTKSYANEHLKEIIQKYVQPFGGKITDFPIPNDNNLNRNVYNGSFQYTISRDVSWIHTDEHNNWAGIVYLTPNAPLTAGTAFYRFHDGSYTKQDGEILKNSDEVNKCSQDITKWQEVDRVGNVFNRLILFNSNRYHMSMDYFGDSKENGRLFQVFFFSTEY